MRAWFYRSQLQIGQEAAAFIASAVNAGQYRLIDSDSEIAWSHLVWLMTAAGRDIVIGHSDPDHERAYVEAILRVNGVDLAQAHEATEAALPPSPTTTIDFTFVVGRTERQS